MIIFARVFLTAAAAVCLLIGAKYLTAKTLFPYHERKIGQKHADLPPAVGRLFLACFRVMGLGIVTVALVILAVAWLPPEHTSKAVLGAAGGAYLLPTLAVTLKVGRNSPWAIIAIAVIFMAAGTGAYLWAS